MNAISLDHIWPALYPAFILGGLIGLTTRTLSGIIVGVVGAGLGAIVGVTLADFADIEMDILRLLVTLVTSGAISLGAIRLTNMLLLGRDRRDGPASDN